MGSKQRVISELLAKTNNYDKDERYMATNDLCKELEGDVKLDSNLERRICTAILKQLDDTSNDVQAVAVKCLSILVKKVEQAQVNDICSKLCNLILTGKAELRDIYSIGLKTCLETLPVEMGPDVAMDLTARLLGGVRNDGDESIKLECLDLLTDLIKFYGHTMSSEHSNISTAALQQLTSPKPIIRKRAGACLGQLATVSSDELLDRVVKTLLKEIETPQQGMDQRTVIQTIGTISRMVGFRLGSHLDQIVPLFLQSLKTPDDESMQTEEADELRENILQAFNSFVLRCPHESAAHMPKILPIMLSFMKYDPNYNYADDEDDDEEEMEDDFGDEEYEDFDDDDYSDEDDTSWKVRRASIKVLSAIIQSRTEINYSSCSRQLIDRFKERDQNVKIDIINCYKELLHSLANKGHLSGVGRSVPTTDFPTSRTMSGHSTDVAMLESGLSKSQSLQNSEALRHVADDVPHVIKASNKILKDKKTFKTRVSVFKVLEELTTVLSGGLTDHIPNLIALIVDSCKLERDSSLVLATLQFAVAMMREHRAEVIQPHLASLEPAVLACVSAEWYKIVAESLRVTSAIIKVMRPGDANAKGSDEDVAMNDSAAMDFDCSKLVRPCYDAILPRLQTHDIDQEIKECAIIAIGTIFARCGDFLRNELDAVLQLLQERLKNEITRLPALKCIEEIAASPLKLSLEHHIESIVTDLVQFLRQQSRTLKQQTLLALDQLVKSNGVHMSFDLFKMVLEGSSKLIDGKDLYLSQMAVTLSISVLHSSNGNEQVLAVIQNETLNQCMKLMTTSVVQQASTLDAVMILFEELVKIHSPQLSFDVLLVMVVKPTQEQAAKLSKTSIASLARSVAAICLASPDAKQRDGTIKKIVQDVSNGLQQKEPNPAFSMHLALLSLGEIGRDLDLSMVDDSVHNFIMSCLDSKSCPEEVKSAAATALGNITLGNMKLYLPLLMKALNERSEQAQQYLLLSSLREVIVRHSSSRASASESLPVDEMLPVLERHCKSDEEGVRNMVAECLGKLTILDAMKLVPHLVNAVQNSSPGATSVCTLVTALKYASVSPVPTEMLKSNIKPFYSLLGDDSLAVRRCTLVALNSVAHHRPEILRVHAREEIIPAVFKDMEVNPAFKRTVDLGPFKHVVDDGEPLRKASFSLLLTMFETMPDVIPVSKFLPQLAKGLADVGDVKMLCHQILTQIAHRHPHVLLAEINVVMDQLSQTLTVPVKEVAKSSNDVIRSALRALDSIAAMHESGQNRRIQEVVENALKKDAIRQMIENDNLDIGKRAGATLAK